MASSTDKVSLAGAREALLRSGYLVESRLDTVLRRKGYYVEANVALPDPDAGKSRELDLYAMKALKAGPEEFDYVFFVPLIECVNNPAPLTLITKEPLVPFLHRSEIKSAGLPAKISGKGNFWVSIPDYLNMEKYHHYCKGRIATQFCSFTKKKGSNDWMAYHDEVQFDAFRKLSLAVEYYMHAHFRGWRFSGKEPINIEFYYPVLVVQGELMECRPAKKSLKLLKATHLQYRRSAFIRPKANAATEFQIDVVRESFFPKYLNIVEKEMSKTARLLRRHEKEVRRSAILVSHQNMLGIHSSESPIAARIFSGDLKRLARRTIVSMALPSPLRNAARDPVPDAWRQAPPENVQLASNIALRMRRFWDLLSPNP